MKHIEAWNRENEIAVQEKRRCRRLLKWGVIIAALCAVYLVAAALWYLEEESVSHTPAPLPVEQVARWMGLPPAPICDNTKSHRVWAECMGVGYNDSATDRYLYKHRADD